MGEETTLREFNRELGAHDVAIDALKDDVAEIKSDVKEILNGLNGHAIQLAEQRLKDKWMNGGIALAAGAGMTWISKQLGLS